MGFVDHLFMILLFIVQPVYGVFESRRYEAEASAGRPLDRIRFYRQTALAEWVFLAVLGAAWFLSGRPIADLGFVSPGGYGFWGGAALLVLFTGYLLYSWRAMTKASDAEKAKQTESLGKIAKYLPHTIREFHSFVGVSITAGIVEEIVYRGFVIWYLSQFMPLWAAVIVSSLAFGFAHGYQGAAGAMRCGLLGLAFGIFYVVTGSIWLPIIAHIVADVLQGAAIHEILRENDEPLEPEPA